jgi:hypothetical protein
MIKGWYYNRESGRRILSVGEIAGACGCSRLKVADWFAGKIITTASEDESYVDAGNVIDFLMRNSMPVPATLLPPKTRKILFIAADDDVFHEQRERIDCITDYFSSYGSVLVETSSSGKFANLTILTFCPDIVVLFLWNIDQENIPTLHLLSSFPDLKTIIFLCKPTADISIDSPLLQGGSLVVDAGLPKVHLQSLLNSTFPC